MRIRGNPKLTACTVHVVMVPGYYFCEHSSTKCQNRALSVVDDHNRCIAIVLQMVSRSWRGLIKVFKGWTFVLAAHVAHVLQDDAVLPISPNCKGPLMSRPYVAPSEWQQ